MSDDASVNTRDGADRSASTIRGYVDKFGGGYFTVWVDRDTAEYPPVGARVVATITVEPPPDLVDRLRSWGGTAEHDLMTEAADEIARLRQIAAPFLATDDPNEAPIDWELPHANESRYHRDRMGQVSCTMDGPHEAHDMALGRCPGQR